MNLIITLTSAGLDSGPFNLFSNIGDYTTAFEINVPKQDLLDGYTSNIVPDGTTTIKVQSVNSLCTNFILLPVSGTTTTTTTTETTRCSTCSVSNVTIETQIWTGCNLDTSTYIDGTLIPEVTDPTEWANLTTGAWCYYNNNPSNCTTYGKLYNWYAVAGIWNEASKTDPSLRKELGVTNYHIPSDEEWTTLTNTLEGASVAGGKLKEAGTTHWASPNTGATNESGFTALPGNYRFNNGSFSSTGSGQFWSSTEDVDIDDNPIAYNRNLSYISNAIGIGLSNKEYGFSIRLIKD